MDRLNELKLRILEWFKESSEKSIPLINKLIEGKDFSRDEVDDLVDVVGKYQAFLICLHEYAKV